MGVTSSNELTRDSMPDLPDEEWPDTWLEFQNGFNRQVLAAITQALPFGNSDLARFKDVDLVHGVASSITSPLGQGVPIQQIIPVGCLGVTVDSTGNPTRAYYNLAVPQIEWHLSSKPDGGGNNQALVTARYPDSTDTALGQIQSVAMSQASPVTLATNTPALVGTGATSVSLSAGVKYQLSGALGFTPTATTTVARIFGGYSIDGSPQAPAITTTANPDRTTGEARGEMSFGGTTPGAGGGTRLVLPLPTFTFTPPTATTLYLVAQAVFAVAGMTAFGYMEARREFAYLTGTRGRVRLLFIGGA